MSHSILITQCLQNDFVAPLNAHEPLPNLLHVGWRESTRLLGEEPSMGPLANFMNWVARQGITSGSLRAASVLGNVRNPMDWR